MTAIPAPLTEAGSACGEQSSSSSTGDGISSNMHKNNNNNNDNTATTAAASICWGQHLAPQDASYASRKLRRQGCLFFLRELFNMVRTSLQQNAKDDFYAMIVLMDVNLYDHLLHKTFFNYNASQMSPSPERHYRGNVQHHCHQQQDKSPIHHYDDSNLATSNTAHRTPVEVVNLLSLLGAILSDPCSPVDGKRQHSHCGMSCVTERGAALDILGSIAMHDASLVRSHCLEDVRNCGERPAKPKPMYPTSTTTENNSASSYLTFDRNTMEFDRNNSIEGNSSFGSRGGDSKNATEVLFECGSDDLLLSLLRLLAVEIDAGLLLQASEILRIILDTEMMGMENQQQQQQQNPNQNQNNNNNAQQQQQQGNNNGVMGNVAGGNMAQNNGINNALHPDENELQMAMLANEHGAPNTGQQQQQHNAAPHLQHHDPEPQPMQHQINPFLTLFYEYYVHWLVMPFQYTISYPCVIVPHDWKKKQLKNRQRMSHQYHSQKYSVSPENIPKRVAKIIVPPCAVRFSFSIELLCFCVRAHPHRMKFFVLRSRVLGSVLRILSPQSPPHANSHYKRGVLGNNTCTNKNGSVGNQQYTPQQQQPYINGSVARTRLRNSHHFNNSNNNNSIIHSSPFGNASNDRCLKLAALRFLRSVIHVRDEFYNRHIVQHNLFEPVFDAFRRNPVGDNLVSSSIIEMCDYIRTDNIRTLLDYIVTRFVLPNNNKNNHQQHSHHPHRTSSSPTSSPSNNDQQQQRSSKQHHRHRQRKYRQGSREHHHAVSVLEELAAPYVDTFSLLRQKYEENKRGLSGGMLGGGGGNRGGNYGLSSPHSFMIDDQDENDYHHGNRRYYNRNDNTSSVQQQQDSQQQQQNIGVNVEGGDGPSSHSAQHRLILNKKVLDDQRKFRERDDEDSYFNEDDDDDDDDDSYHQQQQIQRHSQQQHQQSGNIASPQQRPHSPPPSPPPQRIGIASPQASSPTGEDGNGGSNDRRQFLLDHVSVETSVLSQQLSLPLSPPSTPSPPGTINLREQQMSSNLLDTVTKPIDLSFTATAKTAVSSLNPILTVDGCAAMSIITSSSSPPPSPPSATATSTQSPLHSR
eukprot:CAMPEP_0194373090 /NCGR_PEP_ID=MMETSP0174-20130528/21513_1 /TAXON_ID=216777 /ORGANISM="Proboscia alata, Strain PI-D3" /LENGTH=1084 /DNA_ID=CAMNT_0039151973 /DNA_START=10 /DNA_END=3264 /DNA_ORIENTATION=+